MGPSEYVFCMWNNRLWPAKVLSRHKHPSSKYRLSVEIFVMKKQIEVSLTDTKPFLMDEMLKIGGLKDKTKKHIITTDDLYYQRALKQAIELITQPSCSASRSTPVYEQKGTPADRKECKSSGISIRKNKTTGKCERSNKKNAKDSDAAASKDALEIPTACDTRVSRTKTIVQKNKKRPLDKRQGEETVCDVSLAEEPKSKKRILSVGKLKGSINTFKDLNSLTMSQKKGQQQKRTKQCPVQCRVRLPSKRLQETSTDLQNESSKTGKEKGNGHRVHKYLKHNTPAVEDKKVLSTSFRHKTFSPESSSSDLSMEISSPEYTAGCAMSPSHDTEEDVELPVLVLQKEPTAMKPGSFVWCKFQHYPYWPSLVKLVDSKHKKVTIIFLEESISDPTKKKRSFKVGLRSLKHYDCPEKQQLLENARKDYGKSIDWCDSLISDYRIRLGCGSFSGSFMNYCTAAISLPVRRELESDKREVLFPVLSSKVTEAEQEGTNVKSQSNRKLLPDRARAARDRANEKLVDFILHAKESENHLLDILSMKKTSQWLKKFQSSNRRINCLETYIEDEEQIELVVGYLQTFCEKMSGATKKLMLGDQAQFIFEVLIPEAVIFAIAATGQMSYEEAEVKYLKGPSFTKRERKSFEKEILEKKRLKLSETDKVNQDSRK